MYHLLIQFDKEGTASPLFRCCYFMILKDNLENWARDALLNGDQFLVDVVVSSKQGPYKVTVILDGDHGITIDDCASVSRRLYQVMEDYAKAEPFCRRALEISENIFGPTHPDSSDAQASLAYLLIDENKLRDVFPLAARARQGREKELSNILSFASERQRLDFQKEIKPYTLLAALGRATELAEVVLRQKGVVLDSLLEDRLAVAAVKDKAAQEILWHFHEQLR